MNATVVARKQWGTMRRSRREAREAREAKVGQVTLANQSETERQRFVSTLLIAETRTAELPPRHHACIS